MSTDPDGYRKNTGGMTNFLSELKGLKGDKKLVQPTRSPLFKNEKRSISPVSIVIIIILILTGGFLIRFSFLWKRQAAIVIKSYADLMTEGKAHLSERDFESARKKFDNALALAETDTQRGTAHNLIGKSYVLEIAGAREKKTGIHDNRITNMKRQALIHFQQAVQNGYSSLKQCYDAIRVITRPPKLKGQQAALQAFLKESLKQFDIYQSNSPVNTDTLRFLYNFGELAGMLAGRAVHSPGDQPDDVTKLAIRLGIKCYESVINTPPSKLGGLNGTQQQEVLNLQSNARIFLQRLKDLQHDAAR